MASDVLTERLDVLRCVVDRRKFDVQDNRAKRFRVLSNYGTQVALKGSSGLAIRDPSTGHTIKVPPHRFKRTGILTGTPSPSSALNLWSPFYLIDHGARLHTKFESYQSRFFHKAMEVAGPYTQVRD
jgi:hypothetical protein